MLASCALLLELAFGREGCGAPWRVPSRAKRQLPWTEDALPWAWGSLPWTLELCCLGRWNSSWFWATAA